MNRRTIAVGRPLTGGNSKVVPAKSAPHGGMPDQGTSGQGQGQPVQNSGRPIEEGLFKERPEPAYHPGQRLADDKSKRDQVGALRHGYERLGHMYSLGIPLKFEELQGRHPFDFVEETKEHYKLHPDPVKKPAQPEDTTLFDVREWLEPLIRKGQLYWDYCRDKWLEKESKIGAACAPISCMYSLWSVTDHYLQYGGLAFVAAYLIVTLIFIIPFIYMELILGQFHRQGLVKAIKQTCPLFQGLAYLMLCSSLFDYLLSMTRLSWLLYYLKSSIGLILPWRFCDPNWSSNHCKETLDHDQTGVMYSAGETTPAVDWYRTQVSRPWNHWEQISGKPSTAQIIVGVIPNPLIFFSFLILLLGFRLLMKLWCRPLGTIMFTAFYFAFIGAAFSLLAFHYTFPTHKLNAMMDEFFKLEHLKQLYSKNTWTTALRHAVIGSGLGTGIYITFGSHNTFPHDELKRMSVLSGLGSFAVHNLIAAFLIFCNFTLRTTTAFRNAKTENYGSDIMFEQLPQVAAQHQQLGIGQVMLFSAFSGITLLASLRVLCSLHTIRQHFFDCYKEYFEPCRVNYNYWEHDKIKRQQRYVFLHVTPQRKGELMTRIMLYAAIFQATTFIAGGSDLLFIVEAFWYNYVPVFIIIVECVAVFFLAGVRTLNEYVRKMTTRQVTLWYRFVWKTFIPFVPVLYICTPPRVVEEVGGYVPAWINVVGYVASGLPLFFMYISVLQSWRLSRGKGFCNKFLLEVTPQHEHAGMINGRKPATRMHWMHHLQVPAGISRGPCLPSFEGPPRKPDPNRFNFENRLVNFLWHTCRFRWFNKLGEDCVNHPPDEGISPLTKFHMFPPTLFPMKPPKKERPFPEYLPNKAIKRVHQLKKYKDFLKQRKQWLNEKVDLERERMAAEQDERDIETGIMAAAQAQAEEDEHEFFNLFDSTEEEGWDNTSTESTEDSFDPSSDNGRGRFSSPSVSTSDSFDSQNSIFRISTEEETISKPKYHVESDTTSEEEDEHEDDHALSLDNLEEVIGPPMDYDEGDAIPYDDATDSWDLEALEHLEEDSLPKGDTETSNIETDTDDLIDALDGSPQESDSNEEDDSDEEDDEDELGMEEAAWNPKKASTATIAENVPQDAESEEEDSWSISCGSDSSCSSLYDDDESSEGSDSDEDEDENDSVMTSSRRRANHSSVSASEASYSAKGKPNVKLRFFRSIAEKLDTFLHIRKKTDRERGEIVHEQLKKAHKDQAILRNQKKMKLEKSLEEL